VEAKLAHLGALPLLRGIEGMPDLAFEAEELTADAAGTLGFRKLALDLEGVGRFTCEGMDISPAGSRRELILKSPRFIEGGFGITIAPQEARVVVDEVRKIHVTWDGFKVLLPGNPLKLARLLAAVRGLNQRVKKVKDEVLELPALAVPAGLPDLKLKVLNGEMAIPGAGGRKLTGISLTGTVRGGMVEEGALELCLGQESCSELHLRAGVSTDAVGRVEEVAFKVAGTLPARYLSPRAPIPVKGVENLDVECESVKFDTAGKVQARCRVTAEGLTLEHRRIAPRPIKVPLVRAEGEARIDTREQTLELSLPKVQVGRVYFRTVVDIERFTGLPALRLDVDFPEQSCAALLTSVPHGFAPRLDDVRLKGSLWFKLGFRVDLQEVRKSIKLEVDGDLDRCEAVAMGRSLDVTKLNDDDFVHDVVVGGEPLGIKVGPGTSEYVPLNQIPRAVQMAAYGTEDLAFFRHNGFRVGLIRRAIILFLERGYYAYGGSTISQQLVKNLFMTRDKHLSRKFQEAVIVWQMERELTKERIFELYLNCIEYGPRIWGISKAARVYFGKHPSRLNGMEAAFIMGLKPDPSYGYLQYRRGKLNKHWRKNLNRVLKRLLDINAISRAEYERYARSQLRFRRPGAAAPAPELQTVEDRPVRTGQEEL